MAGAPPTFDDLCSLDKAAFPGAWSSRALSKSRKKVLRRVREHLWLPPACTCVLLCHAGRCTSGALRACAAHLRPGA